MYKFIIIINNYEKNIVKKVCIKISKKNNIYKLGCTWSTWRCWASWWYRISWTTWYTWGPRTTWTSRTCTWCKKSF